MPRRGRSANTSKADFLIQIPGRSTDQLWLCSSKRSEEGEGVTLGLPMCRGGAARPDNPTVEEPWAKDQIIKSLRTKSVESLDQKSSKATFLTIIA
jgi:hypothetical protein